MAPVVVVRGSSPEISSEKAITHSSSWDLTGAAASAGLAGEVLGGTACSHTASSAATAVTSDTRTNARRDTLRDASEPAMMPLPHPSALSGLPLGGRF